ncbi:uncharacterized protein G2W53_028555 [Senna tora]|uniref:Uncharacterized protein n=1 Tax=Senna tora TaxID=362788 RepID=A0A834T3G9_9FABA|nr:uncharacterized protein G2W53_028555 [Senna tora]
MASSPIPSTSPNHAPFIPNRLICFITLPPPSSSSSSPSPSSSLEAAYVQGRTEKV